MIPKEKSILSRNYLAKNHPEIYSFVCGTASIVAWAVVWRITDHFIDFNLDDSLNRGKILRMGILLIIAFSIMHTTKSLINLFGSKEALDEILGDVEKEEKEIKKEEEMTEKLIEEVKQIKEEMIKINNRI